MKIYKKSKQLKLKARSCQYLLVVKNDLSHFVELIPFLLPILIWFTKCFSTTTEIMNCLTSCQWSRNSLQERSDCWIERSNATDHQFTTAYVPQATGTVEHVNGEILKDLDCLFFSLNCLGKMSQIYCLWLCIETTEKWTRKPKEATDIAKMTADLLDSLWDIRKKVQDVGGAHRSIGKKNDIFLPNFEQGDFVA